MTQSTQEGVQTMHEAPARDEEIVGSARIHEGAEVGGNDRLTRISYLAGFFDGEGHISIRDKNKTGRYNLTIGAGQMKAKPLELLKEAFGGNICGPDPRGMYRWVGPWGEGAADALEEMLPFLTVKAAQARVALEFQSWRPYYRPRKWGSNQERGREATRRYRARKLGEVVEYDGSRPRVPESEKRIAEGFVRRLLEAR